MPTNRSAPGRCRKCFAPRPVRTVLDEHGNQAANGEYAGLIRLEEAAGALIAESDSEGVMDDDSIRAALDEIKEALHAAW
jgi:hypothetical protein